MLEMLYWFSLRDERKFGDDFRFVWGVMATVFVHLEKDGVEILSLDEGVEV